MIGDEADAEDGDPDEVLRRNPALDEKLRAVFRDLQPPETSEIATGSSFLAQTLGDFRILRKIGSGGMSTVYEAEQVSLGRRVALKVLSPHLGLSRRSVRRFHREAEAGGRQSHPGIVAVHAVGKSKGIRYIAQELVEGGRTLADRIRELREAGAAPDGHFRSAAAQIALVADALGHAHSCDVIHRDVKPSNILIDPDGSPKVSDFGLARVEDAASISHSGEFIGTPLYMSPEQVVTKPSAVDHRADVYSLGVTLYELVTLERPFSGASSAEVVKRILQQEPRDPHRRNPRIPKDLAAICMRAMEKEPRDRYQSMAELARDLRRFHGGEAVLARSPGWVGRTRRWTGRHLLSSLAGGAVVIASIALIVLATQLSEQRRRDRSLAEERYQLVRDALGWLDYRVNESTGFTCVLADPGDPSGPMLSALSHIQSRALDEAVADLEACVAACRGRGEDDLERDAHYLLGVVQVERARGSPAAERDALLDVAETELLAAGDFDPVSRRDFVWREVEPGMVHAGGSVNLRDLRVDREHYLVPFYRGLSIFDHLYKGGEREEFERGIDLLEAALEARPENAIALTCLGRTYYFYARTYGFLHLLARAEELLERAIVAPQERPYQLPYTTLGQLWLLHGSPERALSSFERARDSLLAEKDRNAHNVFKGMGQAYLEMGRRDEAEPILLHAGEVQPLDPHVCVSLAELYLPTAPERSLEYAQRALGHYQGKDPKIRARSLVASTVVACARAQLALGDVAAAIDTLANLTGNSISSPADFARACQLIASLPEESAAANAGSRGPRELAAGLGSYLSMVDDGFRGFESPICHGGRGAALYVQGRYGEAITDLERALAARARWPAELAAGHWFEEAIDLYVLAMARHALAGSGPAPDDGEARAALARAGELVREHGPPRVRGDVLERIRLRAGAVLGAR